MVGICLLVKFIGKGSDNNRANLSMFLKYKVCFFKKYLRKYLTVLLCNADRHVKG